MKSLVVIFRFKNYKTYLFTVEEEFSRFNRGFRSRLAEKLHVQSAFISKVLNQDEFHFSLEHALTLAQLLELQKDERDYFMWLVQWARAGTKELKNFFYELIEGVHHRHLNIKNRVGEAVTLSAEDQNQFYSHWLYGAAHVLSSIPQYKTLNEMAKALRVDEAMLLDILTFLVRTGLVHQQGEKFVVGEAQLHLAKNSPNIAKHHTNWRLKAIDDASNSRHQGVHYSTVSSLSEDDFDKLHHELTQVIEDYVAKVRPSKEETACCFNLDFFRLV